MNKQLKRFKKKNKLYFKNTDKSSINEQLVRVDTASEEIFAFLYTRIYSHGVGKKFEEMNRDVTRSKDLVPVEVIAPADLEVEFLKLTRKFRKVTIYYNTAYMPIINLKLSKHEPSKV